MREYDKAMAMRFLGPMILSRPYGTHPRVLEKLGIPKREWPTIWAMYGRHIPMEQQEPTRP